MKFNKFFMLGLAGLAFAACSNEEEGTGNLFPEGHGAVTIKIASPALSRAIENQNSSNVTVKPASGSDVTITCTGTGYNETLTISDTDWNKLATNTTTNGKEVTFWNVPTIDNNLKVTVSMNGGKATYENTDLITDANLQKVENVPVYGETNKFTETAETGSPTLNSANETGASSGDENKTYQIYTATVKLAIPVARLEVSGITHKTHDTSNGDNCSFGTLTIGGVYLDNIIPNGAGVSYSENEDSSTGEPTSSFCVANGTPTDYKFNASNGIGTDTVPATFKDLIPSLTNITDKDTSTDFLSTTTTWPNTSGKAYGYNFFGANGEANLPQFKIYFSEAAAPSGSSVIIPETAHYAMIKKYRRTVNGTTEDITKFEPGHIYRITNAVVDDDNIIIDENGNQTYGITVTVLEAVWQVEEISGVWTK